MTGTKKKKIREKWYSPLKTLSERVSPKLEEGDFKGVVRLASSEETLASFSKATLASLKKKSTPYTDNSFFSLPLVVNQIPVHKLWRSK